MNRRAPLIGVSTSITVGASPERAYVNSAYLHAVQQAGGVPVALPPQLSSASMRQLAGDLQGLLLTGGGDMDPALFGETPHATLYDVAPARDTLETSVLHVALDRGLPVLAVCRGLQVLNVALGGSLHQDVGTDPGTQDRSRDPQPRDAVVECRRDWSCMAPSSRGPRSCVPRLQYNTPRGVARGRNDVGVIRQTT